MGRKVILHGPSTLTISIPAKWAKQHGIKKGDDLTVEEEGRFLYVYPGKTSPLVRRTRADFSNLSDAGIRSIMAMLHKSGYDEIEITVSSSAELKAI